jgi:hypothetical protein
LNAFDRATRQPVFVALRTSIQSTAINRNLDRIADPAQSRHVMNPSTSMAARGLRMQPLAACLVLAMAVANSASIAADARGTTDVTVSRRFVPGQRGQPGLPPRYANRSAVAKHYAPIHTAPNRPPATLPVINCDDAGFGSLRDTVTFSAMSGDTVDLSALPCSTITLTGGAIIVNQHDLFLTGPGASALAIDGGGNDRVIAHAGYGRLTIIDLTITHGKYTNSTSYAHGGCLDSLANITLTNSIVYNCEAGGRNGADAFGGGIFTKGDLHLLNSTVTGNLAISTVDGTEGGGAYVRGYFLSLYSTISNNRATSPGIHNFGGGVFTLGKAHLKTSTISGNYSSNDAAWTAIARYGYSATATITNSTISGNIASNRVGGIYTRIPLTLSNSTIAFNREADTGPGSLVLLGALYSHGAALTLQSSIIADNISDSTGQPLDLTAFGGATVSGANNLITSVSGLLAPPDTVTDCPNLGPLADNGGVTMTHALLRDGPAVGAGNNAAGLAFDQRGPGFPRTSGFNPDIGAYEWQGTPDDPIMLSGFEVACDH